MPPTLFGVPIPEGAVRVVIRPVLGAGGSLPLFEGLQEAGAWPTDSKIQADVARNADFWGYVDARVSARKLARPTDDTWAWKLRLQFYDQLGVEDVKVTDGTHEFYRSVTAGNGFGETSAEARMLMLFERGIAAVEQVGKSACDAIGKVSEFATAAIGKCSDSASTSVAKSCEAGSAAVAEATKQTAVVAELTKLIHAESLELKEGIFELQTKRAEKSVSPPKTVAEDIKEGVDTLRTVLSLADSFGGSQQAPPAGTAGGSAGAGASK